MCALKKQPFQRLREKKRQKMLSFEFKNDSLAFMTLLEMVPEKEPGFTPQVPTPGKLNKMTLSIKKFGIMAMTNGRQS